MSKPRKRIMHIFHFLKKHLNIYMIEIGVFLVIILITDRYSVINRMKTRRKIEEIEIKIEKLQKEKEIYQEHLSEIEKGGESLEKFAREYYHMKKPDEEIFVIKDD